MSPILLNSTAREATFDTQKLAPPQVHATGDHGGPVRVGADARPRESPLYPAIDRQHVMA
jgi:hypothetical protein